MAKSSTEDSSGYEICLDRNIISCKAWMAKKVTNVIRHEDQHKEETDEDCSTIESSSKDAR